MANCEKPYYTLNGLLNPVQKKLYHNTKTIYGSRTLLTSYESIFISKYICMKNNRHEKYNAYNSASLRIEGAVRVPVNVLLNMSTVYGKLPMDDADTLLCGCSYCIKGAL